MKLRAILLLSIAAIASVHASDPVTTRSLRGADMGPGMSMMEANQQPMKSLSKKDELISRAKSTEDYRDMKKGQKGQIKQEKKTKMEMRYDEDMGDDDDDDDDDDVDGLGEFMRPGMSMMEANQQPKKSLSKKDELISRAKSTEDYRDMEKGQKGQIKQEKKTKMEMRYDEDMGDDDDYDDDDDDDDAMPVANMAAEANPTPRRTKRLGMKQSGKKQKRKSKHNRTHEARRKQKLLKKRQQLEMQKAPNTGGVPAVNMAAQYDRKYKLKYKPHSTKN